MRRDQLEHAIRAACQIIGHTEVIVVGSQAILGTYDETELPDAATMSREVDILPIADDNMETARLADIIDLSSVELTHIKQARAQDQTLDLATGETIALKPMTATGSGQSRDPHMVLLEEVLAKINALFDGEDFTPGQQRSWVEGLVTVLGENNTVRSQAAANTSKQFVESPDLSDAVAGAVMDAGDAHAKMTDKFFSDERFKAGLVKLLGELVYSDLNRGA